MNPSRFRPALSPLENRVNPASTFTASGAIAGGAPLVEVTNPSGVVISQFQAFGGNFSGGVRADTGELDGNPGTIEVAVAAGPGGGPRVQVYSVDKTTGATALIGDFFAFEPSFRDGLRIAVGNVSGSADGLDQIIVGADAGGGPRVATFRFDNGVATPLAGPLGNFFAFEDTFRGGVRVAAGELDANPGDGDELAVAAGPGGGPRVRVFRDDGTVLDDFFAAPPGSTLDGVNVAYDVASGTLKTDFGAQDFSQRDERLNQPIEAALAAAQAAALAAGNAGGSAASGFTIGQSGGSSTNAVAGAFGTVQNSNLGAFGTIQTSNQGAFSTTQTSNQGAFSTTQTSNQGAFGTTQTSN
ncbi:MAG TPA: hypothetical protein VH092_35840, partial [Urbifossiella sp.]|nr:hypothetical protein [Urbifossiella sp.]